MAIKFLNKEVFAARLRQLMDDNNETIYSMAEFLKLSPSAISKYTNAQIGPQHTTLDAISNKFGVNPLWLAGAPDAEMHPEGLVSYKNIPVYINTEIIRYESVETYVRVEYCIVQNDDSMIGSRIFENDILFINKSAKPVSGDIVLVEINGEEKVRRYFEYGRSIVFRPENPNYAEEVFKANEYSIKGKVVAVKFIIDVEGYNG